MEQVFSVCFAAPVLFVLAMVTCVLILALMAKTLDAVIVDGSLDGKDEPEARNRHHIDCLKCQRRIRYVMPEVLVRCSCGNVMSRPTGPSASCPKCFDTIHVSRSRGPLRVKCPCGNVATVRP
jgi:hypothetical protein